MNLHRREFSALALGAAAGLSLAGKASAHSDPLPSWNDRPAKEAILKFVRETTDSSSPNFVAPPERIATFDQDGTLWVEHPIYTQIVYCFDRVPAVAKANPELAEAEPFKTVLSGDREAIARLPMEALLKIAAATLFGMDVETYRDEVASWLEGAHDQRWKRGRDPGRNWNQCPDVRHGADRKRRRNARIHHDRNHPAVKKSHAPAESAPQVEVLTAIFRIADGQLSETERTRECHYRHAAPDSRE